MAPTGRCETKLGLHVTISRGAAPTRPASPMCMHPDPKAERPSKVSCRSTAMAATECSPSAAMRSSPSAGHRRFCELAAAGPAPASTCASLYAIEKGSVAAALRSGVPSAGKGAGQPLKSLRPGARQARVHQPIDRSTVNRRKALFAGSDGGGEHWAGQRIADRNLRAHCH
jgi:hypothetical protein